MVEANTERYARTLHVLLDDLEQLRNKEHKLQKKLGLFWNIKSVVALLAWPASAVFLILNPSVADFVFEGGKSVYLYDFYKYSFIAYISAFAGFNGGYLLSIFKEKSFESEFHKRTGKTPGEAVYYLEKMSEKDPMYKPWKQKIQQSEKSEEDIEFDRIMGPPVKENDLDNLKNSKDDSNGFISKLRTAGKKS